VTGTVLGSPPGGVVPGPLGGAPGGFGMGGVGGGGAFAAPLVSDEPDSELEPGATVLGSCAGRGSPTCWHATLLHVSKYKDATR
jgi:hypothetical protein